MPTLKFISEIISRRSIILLTNVRQPISAAVAKLLRPHPNLQLVEMVEANTSVLPAPPINVVVHFAGFDKPSLAQTLHHTSSLHRLMDYCLQHNAKLILVLPENKSPEQETAIALTRQFGKNFHLNYTIITVPSDLGVSAAARAVIRIFIHNFEPRPIVSAPVITMPPPQKDRFLLKIAIAVVLVITVPWMIFLAGLGVGAFSLHCGYESLKLGHWSTARNCARIASAAASFLRRESLGVMGSGTLVSRTGFTTDDFFIASKLLAQNIYLLGQAGELATTGKLPELTVLLPKLSEQLAYSQADLQKLPHTEVWRQGLADLRSLLAKASLVLPGLEKIMDTPKQVWLVLLQDADELRPTGGFIGNFALVSLEEGQMTDVQLYDTDDTDGLLRGQVEPPSDFAKATHQANWYLRDSNWDPRFPESAAKAAWFVGKELGQEVDGVIGLNSRLLPQVGQILGIKNSWAELLTQLKTATPDQRQQVWSVVLQELERRQITLAPLTYALPLHLVGWDGGIDCCAQDTIYVVDSNVGVNKVNSHVQPKYKLDLTLDSTVVNYNFNFTYVNTSASEAWPLGDYTNYVRLMVPSQFQLDQISIDNNPVPASSITIGEQGGMAVWGVLVHVPVGESKTLTVLAHRSINVTTNPTYQLHWLNQPGQPPIPLTIASGDKLGYNGVLSSPVEMSLKLN